VAGLLPLAPMHTLLKDSTLVGALVGVLVGALVGVLVGALVGVLVGALVGLFVGSGDGGSDAELPPPQTQQARLAVSPSEA
jgi:uncharacterized protein YcfJ